MKQQLVAKLINFNPKLAEQLRKYAYVNHTTQTKVVNDALKFFFTNPPVDPNQETNYDHATMDMEEHGNK